VDLLAALARKEGGRLEPERSEHGRVKGERTAKVAADEVDVAESDEHGSIRSQDRQSGSRRVETPAVTLFNQGRR
jgi:hypothetical protein